MAGKVFEPDEPLFRKNISIFSPNVKESGIPQMEGFGIRDPERGIRNPLNGILSPRISMQSRIHFGGTSEFGIRNPRL